MDGKTILLVLLALSGVGLVGFMIFFFFNLIQQQNAQLLQDQTQIATMSQAAKDQGGLLGTIGGIAQSIFG